MRKVPYKKLDQEGRGFISAALNQRNLIDYRGASYRNHDRAFRMSAVFLGCPTSTVLPFHSLTPWHIFLVKFAVDDAKIPLGAFHALLHGYVSDITVAINKEYDDGQSICMQ